MKDRNKDPVGFLIRQLKRETEGSLAIYSARRKEVGHESTARKFHHPSEPEEDLDGLLDSKVEESLMFINDRLRDLAKAVERKQRL